MVSITDDCRICGKEINTVLESEVATWKRTDMDGVCRYKFYSHVSCLQKCSMPSCDTLFYPKPNETEYFDILYKVTSPKSKNLINLVFFVLSGPIFESRKPLTRKYHSKFVRNDQLFIADANLADDALICGYCSDWDKFREFQRIGEETKRSRAAALKKKRAEAAAEKKAKEVAAAKKKAEAAAEKKAKEERKKERESLVAAKVHMELITSYIAGLFPKYILLLITKVFGETENKDNLVDILLSLIHNRQAKEFNQNWSDPAALDYWKKQIDILFSIYTMSEKRNVLLSNILSVVVNNRLLFGGVFLKNQIFVGGNPANWRGLARSLEEAGDIATAQKCHAKANEIDNGVESVTVETPLPVEQTETEEDIKNVFSSTSWNGFDEDSLVRITNLERWLEYVETECLFEGIFSYPQMITYDEALELIECGFEEHPEALLEVVMGGAHWEVVAVKHGFYQL